MVKLKEITPDNFEEVLNLKVAEHQKSFVSTVAYSLAQAWVYKTAYPFAIYADDKAVVLLCWDIMKQEINIHYGNS